MLLIKIKQPDLLRDGKTFLIHEIAYFTRVYMICLIFPSASQSAPTGKLQARAKLSAFEYENQEGRGSSNHANWSSFKETPYRNPDTSLYNFIFCKPI